MFHTPNLLKKLLTGTAVISLLIATEAMAQTVEMDGSTVVSGAGIVNTDQIIDAVEGTDTLEVDLNGTSLTLGTDSTTAGIDASGAGEADASTIFFANTNATAGSVTIEDNGSGVAVLTDGATTALTLSVGQEADATDATGNILVTIDGDIATVTGGSVSLSYANDTDTSQIYAFAITGNADLGAGTVIFNNTADTLTFSGSGAQSFTGAITATAAGDGAITIARTGGAVTMVSDIGTATETVGSITLANDGNDVSASFQANVYTTSGLTLGDGAGTETNAVTFDSTSASLIVEGAVTGGAATQTNNLTVSGGNTVTLQSSSGTNIDALSVAVDTTLALGENEAAGAGDNSITYTGDITGGGTLTFNGDDDDATGHTISGNVGTSGTPMLVLNIDNDNADTATSIDVHTVTGNVYATSIAFSASDDTAANTEGGNLTLDAENGNSVLQAASITTAISGDGNLSLTPGVSANTLSATITGDIGTNALRLGAIAVGSSNGDATLNAQGNVYATALTFDGESTLNLTASSGTVTGTINGADANGEGNIIVGDGATASVYTFTDAAGATFDLDLVQVSNLSSLTIQDNLGITAADGVDGLTSGTTSTFTIDASNNTVDVIAADGNINFDGTTTINGGSNNVSISAADALNIDGTFSSLMGTATTTLTSNSDVLNIGTSADTTFTTSNQVILGTGAVSIGASGLSNRINITKTSDFDPTATAVFEGVTNSTVVTVDTDSTLTVGLSTSSLDFNDGDTITVIDGGVNATTSYSTAITNGDIVLADTLFLDLDGSTSTDQDLIISINVKDGSDVLTGTGQNAADVILATDVDNIAGTLATIRASLLDQTDAAAASEIAEASVPTVDRGAIEASLHAIDLSQEVTGMRLASLRSGEVPTGMSAGTIAKGLKVWGQSYAGFGSQDDRDGVDGYDFTTYGGTFGMDTETLFDNTVLGVSIGYAASQIDSDNANRTDTEVDSLQLAVYGEYDVDKHTYVNAQFGFGYGDTEVTRKNVGGISGTNAFGTFDSEQVFASAEVGRKYLLGKATRVTPRLLVDYTNYSSDQYTERLAGSASLVIDQDDVNILEFGAGVDFSWLYQDTSGAFLKPELRAEVAYDVIGDEVNTVARYIRGAGQTFRTQGADPAQTSFNLGTGVTYFGTSSWDFGVDYDFEFKEDFSAHSGYLKATYKF